MSSITPTITATKHSVVTTLSLAAAPTPANGSLPTLSEALALWFAIHTIFRQVTPVRGYGLHLDAPVLLSADPWALALSAAAIIAIFRFKIGMMWTLAGCSLIGIDLLGGRL